MFLSDTGGLHVAIGLCNYKHYLVSRSENQQFQLEIRLDPITMLNLQQFYPFSFENQIRTTVIRV
jgi:hypothetical protein